MDSEPGAYVVHGYLDRMMPRWYGQKLSAGALEKIAAYLEQITEEGPSSQQAQSVGWDLPAGERRSQPVECSGRELCRGALEFASRTT